METFTPYNQIFVFRKVMYVQYVFSYLIVIRDRPKLTLSFDVHKIKANSNGNKNEKRKTKQPHLFSFYSFATAAVQGVKVLFARIYAGYHLKVHKIENFLGSEFEFCTISLLVVLKY